MYFNFIGSKRFEIENLNNIGKFVESYPDFQSIALNNEKELHLLLQLMGIEGVEFQYLNNSTFPKYWNLSNFKLPEYNEKEFDQFYKNWLNLSQKENTMDEYGQLIFLSELSKKWNKLNHRIILKEC
jgi:hypothetical protein